MLKLGFSLVFSVLLAMPWVAAMADVPVTPILCQAGHGETCHQMYPGNVGPAETKIQFLVECAEPNNPSNRWDPAKLECTSPSVVMGCKSPETATCQCTNDNLTARSKVMADVHS